MTDDKNLVGAPANFDIQEKESEEVNEIGSIPLALKGVNDGKIGCRDGRSSSKVGTIGKGVGAVRDGST